MRKKRRGDDEEEEDLNEAEKRMKNKCERNKTATQGREKERKSPRKGRNRKRK